jgi:inner membrane protein
MPSPIGHLLGGAAVYLAGTAPHTRSMLVFAIVLLASIAPDFDFVPGIVIGDMRRFHHGISHSLAFAVLFGGVVFVVARAVDRRIAVRASMLAALAYAAHAVLDFISVNEGTRGVPLLWPFSDESLGVSLHLFGHFRYGDINEGIWSVVRWVNVSPLLRELVILGTLVFVLLRREQIRRAFAFRGTGKGTDHT